MLEKLLRHLRDAVDKRRAAQTSRAFLRGYRDCLERMVADHTIDADEVTALKTQQQGLALDPVAVRQIHRDAFTELAARALEPGHASEAELQKLAEIGTALGLTWQDLPPNLLQRAQIAGTLIKIQHGQLPSLAPNGTRLHTVAGEVVHAEVVAQLLDERTYRQYVGGSSGYSFRIAKGVSYRVGSTRGISIPVTEIVPIDAGVLSVSSKRIAFLGAHRSFTSEWSKVLSADPKADGLVLAFTNRKKTAVLKYADPAYAEVLATIISHYLS